MPGRASLVACPSPGPCLKEPLLPWPLRPPGFWAVAGPSPGTDMTVCLCAWPTPGSSHS